MVDIGNGDGALGMGYLWIEGDYGERGCMRSEYGVIDNMEYGCYFICKVLLLLSNF